MGKCDKHSSIATHSTILFFARVANAVRICKHTRSLHDRLKFTSLKFIKHRNFWRYDFRWRAIYAVVYRFDIFRGVVF